MKSSFISRPTTWSVPKGRDDALADHGVADTARESRRAEGASLQEIELEDLPEGGIRIRDVTRPVLKPVHGRGGQLRLAWAIHIDGGNSLRPFQRIAAFLHQGQSQRRVGDAPVIILAIAHDGRYVAGAGHEFTSGLEHAPYSRHTG